MCIQPIATNKYHNVQDNCLQKNEKVIHVMLFIQVNKMHAMIALNDSVN